MSVLQQLNGHNAPNPLACIEGESLYDAQGFGLGRWLRADLVVDTSRLKVASRRLGDHYIWRHRNWLEAKFMRVRNQGPVSNKTTPTALLLADLIRLCVLVPENPGETSHNGRYMLHVYDRPPSNYLSFKRNKNSNGPGGSRPWVRSVTQAGSSSIHLAELNHESPTFAGHLGDLGGLTIDAEVTTFAIEPVSVHTASPLPLYWCFLTRIDALEVELDGRSFMVDELRTVHEINKGDRRFIRAHVATRLGQVTENDESPPDDMVTIEDQEEPDLLEMGTIDSQGMPSE